MALFGLTALLGATIAPLADGLCDMASAAAGTPPVKEWAAEVRRRAAAHLPLPVNHDLVRGIRTAHLTALDRIARRHAALLDTLPAREIGNDERPFAASLRGFLDARLKLLHAGSLDFGAVTDAQVAHVLDHLVHPSTTEGYAECARHARQAAEAAALEELRQDAGRPCPPLLARLFAGGETPGWYDIFALSVNERIKTEERFRSIFLAAELVDIKRLVGAVEGRIAALLARGTERIEVRFDRIETKLDSEAERAEARHRELMAAVAREKGVPHATLATVLRRFGEEGVPEEQYQSLLLAKADEYTALRDELARLRNDRPDVAATRARALALLEAGDFAAARATLSSARGWLRALRQQTAREEASIAFEEARIARVEVRYLEAAALLEEAAELVAFDAKAAWVALIEAADCLEVHGRDFGNNASLRAAIDIYGRALHLAPRERAPRDWAMTQNNLGLALTALGERETGTERLEDAAAAYRVALEENTRARAPLDWAMTQNNLGNTLAILGGRESGTERLEEAVAAYRAALEETTRARAPLDWATTQNNLGNVLLTLGGRKSGTERLEEAITAYRAALEERTRERAPSGWATTQNNLGNALQTLGKRGTSTERLEEAINAYRAALEERTRDRVPLAWAMTQNNLGVALQSLGESDSSTERLEEAIVAHRAALEERTRHRVPLDWAATQNNLGSALQTLGGRESGTARLEEAVTAYRAALEEYTRERVPLDWAATLNNLGNALGTLGERESGTARLEEAVTAYRAALEEYTRERVPLGWAATQNNLGIALWTLGGRESGTAHLEEAVAAYRAALEERTRERAPFRHAQTLETLALAEEALGDRLPSPAHHCEALSHARAALTIYQEAGAAFFIEGCTRLVAWIEAKLP